MARIRAALSRDAVALAVIVAAAATFSAVWTLRVREWGFMTDEMLYAKLALHFAETGSPVPHIRGEYLPEFKLLYPTLIAPIVGLLSMPAAFVVVHGLNSLLVATSAIPGYLLGREIGLSRRGRLLVAGIVPILPWTVMSMFVMTESLAYPLFILAACGIVRAVARPTPRREGLALGLIVLATTARAQFLGLLPIFTITAILFDVGRARRTGASVWLAIRERRVLWAGIVGLLLVGLALSAAGTNGGITWASARLRASGVGAADVLSSSRQTFSVLLVLCGIAPMALGIAGAVSGIVRPRNPATSALAIMAPLALVALVVSNASYTVRGLDALIHERFAVYAVPLLLPLAVQFLEHPRAVRSSLAAALAVSLLGVTAFTRAAGHHYSYAEPIDRVIVGRTEQIGRALGVQQLSATWLLVPAAIAICVSAAVLIRRVSPTVTVAVFAVAVVPFLLGSSVFDYNRALHPIANENNIGLGPHSDSGGGNWVDRALPDGERAGFVPTSVSDTAATRKIWWDLEFWNKSVTTMYSLAPAWVDSGFATDAITVDQRTGRMTVPRPLSYVVVPVQDRRMAPVGRTVATNGPLRLVRVAQPLRTLWGAGGFGDDGWSNPTTTPFVRLYSSPETAGRRVVVALTVTAPASASHPRRVDVRGSIGNAGGWAPAGGADTITVRACVPRSKARDLGLIVHGSTRVDGRPTGIALLTADVKPDGVCGHRAAP